MLNHENRIEEQLSVKMLLKLKRNDFVRGFVWLKSSIAAQVNYYYKGRVLMINAYDYKNRITYNKNNNRNLIILTVCTLISVTVNALLVLSPEKVDSAQCYGLMY